MVDYSGNATINGVQCVRVPSNFTVDTLSFEASHAHDHYKT